MTVARNPPFCYTTECIGPPHHTHIRRNTVPRATHCGVVSVKGSSVERSVERWPVRDGAHVAYFSYRWVAWAVVALTLTLPGLPVMTLPRDAGLLLLTGVLNVVATALAPGYVRLATQRPVLLALDLIVGATILWLSGSHPLPFLPYASAALVLPALLFGWRGALLGAVVFLTLDLVGLALLNPAVGASMYGPSMLARMLTPFAFAGIWATLGYGVPRRSTANGAHPAPPEVLVAQPTQPTEEPPPNQPQPLHVPDHLHPETTSAGTTNVFASGPLVLTRASAEQRADLTRRLLFDLTPPQSLGFTASLEQIGTVAARQSGFEVAVTCVGSPRILTQAQQSLLLRTAHEALRNVQQHAHAQRVRLTLTFEATTVTLVIQDDGGGLLDGTYERPGLHALRALRYRLAELDGHLTVFEPESSGVTVQASLPLEP